MSTLAHRDGLCVLPKRGFQVYRLWAPDGRLIYVGSTKNLRNRANAHLTADYGDEWETITWDEYSTLKRARFAEVIAITHEHPVWNDLGIGSYGAWELLKDRSWTKDRRKAEERAALRAAEDHQRLVDRVAELEAEVWALNEVVGDDHAHERDNRSLAFAWFKDCLADLYARLEDLLFSDDERAEAANEWFLRRISDEDSEIAALRDEVYLYRVSGSNEAMNVLRSQTRDIARLRALVAVLQQREIPYNGGPIPSDTEVAIFEGSPPWCRPVPRPQSPKPRPRGAHTPWRSDLFTAVRNPDPPAVTDGPHLEPYIRYGTIEKARIVGEDGRTRVRYDPGRGFAANDFERTPPASEAEAFIAQLGGEYDEATRSWIIDDAALLRQVDVSNAIYRMLGVHGIAQVH